MPKKWHKSFLCSILLWGQKGVQLNRLKNRTLFLTAIITRASEVRQLRTQCEHTTSEASQPPAGTSFKTGRRPVKKASWSNLSFFRSFGNFPIDYNSC